MDSRAARAGSAGARGDGDDSQGLLKFMGHSCVYGPKLYVSAMANYDRELLVSHRITTAVVCKNTSKK